MSAILITGQVSDVQLVVNVNYSLVFSLFFFFLFLLLRSSANFSLSVRTHNSEGEHYLIRKPLGLININVSATEPVTGHANGINDISNSTSRPSDDLLRINLSAIERTASDPNQIPTRDCVQAAILELPSDGLTRGDRQHGWIMIHVLLACYCFWMLAVICNEYFVPAIEAMCSSKCSTKFHANKIRRWTQMGFFFFLVFFCYLPN